MALNVGVDVGTGPVNVGSASSNKFRQSLPQLRPRATLRGRHVLKRQAVEIAVVSQVERSCEAQTRRAKVVRISWDLAICRVVFQHYSTCQVTVRAHRLALGDAISRVSFAHLQLAEVATQL